MQREAHSLADADISSRRHVTRRVLLGTLGLGATLTAATGFQRAAQAQTRRDPCRDRDHGPSDEDGCGRPPTS